jgi:hypothetical protein
MNFNAFSLRIIRSQDANDVVFQPMMLKEKAMTTALIDLEIRLLH